MTGQTISGLKEKVDRMKQQVQEMDEKELSH